MRAASRSWTVALALAACACGGSGDPGPAPSGGGGGGATLLVSAPAGHLPASVLTGRSMEARALDVDVDGDLDLLVAREASPNVLLINDGSGRFSDASAQRIPQTARDGEDIAAADFDRDGDVDLVIVSEDQVGSATVPKHAYYVNTGGGTFTDASARIPGRAVANAVAAADIDGDGDADLVLGNNGPESVLVNDGSGGFADESFRVPAVADVTQDVLLADVDRDGDPDLIVANEEAGPNRLLLNNGAGVFTLAAAAIPLRTQAEATRNADLGDVDGDGDLDLVFANVVVSGSSPQSRLLLNDGAGRFTDVTADRLPVMTAASMDAEFVDLDRDGDLDLLTAPFPSNLYRAFVNDGAGRFTEATASVFPAGLSGQAIEIEPGDFNRDGRVDVYLANYIESPDLLLFAR